MLVIPLLVGSTKRVEEGVNIFKGRSGLRSRLVSGVYFSEIQRKTSGVRMIENAAQWPVQKLSINSMVRLCTQIWAWSVDVPASLLWRGGVFRSLLPMGMTFHEFRLQHVSAVRYIAVLLLRWWWLLPGYFVEDRGRGGSTKGGSEKIRHSLTNQIKNSLLRTTEARAPTSF